MAFLRSDKENTGTLEKYEIFQALDKLGLHPIVNERLRKKLENVNDVITLPMWYDVVGEIYKTDGVASFHSPIIGIFLKPFIRWERNSRKKIVLRRMAAATRSGKISKHVLESTLHHHLSQNTPIRNNLCSGLSRDESSIIIEELQELSSVESAISVCSRGVNDDKYNIESIITQYELSDPSSVIARKIAGYIDMFGSILLPILYTSLIVSVLSSYGNVFDITNSNEFDGTRITHVFNGTSETSCCY